MAGNPPRRGIRHGGESATAGNRAYKTPDLKFSNVLRTRGRPRTGWRFMKRSKTEIYVHFVWATWERAPLIAPEMEQRLFTCIAREAESLGCIVLAINGMQDHV